jgi:hypothetical protein
VASEGSGTRVGVSAFDGSYVSHLQLELELELELELPSPHVIGYAVSARGRLSLNFNWASYNKILLQALVTWWKCV